MKAKRPKKTGTYYHSDRAFCFSRGSAFSTIYERVRSASGSLNSGDLVSAEHNLYLAKIDLEKYGQNGLVPKSTASRLAKAIDNPFQAIKKARDAKARGKRAGVSTGRIHPILTSIQKAKDRASNECAFGEIL